MDQVAPCIGKNRKSSPSDLQRHSLKIKKNPTFYRSAEESDQVCDIVMAMGWTRWSAVFRKIAKVYIPVFRVLVSK